MKKVLISTLLGSIALIGLIFLMSVFDKALWNELVEDGFFHITYALILIVPFLAVLFFVILIFVKLVQKVNPKVPLTLVPFLITVVGLSIGSIGEPYLLEFKTHAYFVIAGILVTLSSMPILKVVKP
jgi:FtsH-binding integral membrane protein